MLRGRGLNASFQRFYARLQLYRERWWYTPLMCALVFADLFILVIPSDLLVVKTALLRPEHWLRSTLALITASAFGAVALAWSVHELAPTVIQWILGDAMQDPSWLKTQAFIQKHGVWALGVISFSPLPQQAPVAIASLGGMTYTQIFLAIWLGRAPKYLGFAYIARRAPQFYEQKLKKWIGADELEEPPIPPEHNKR